MTAEAALPVDKTICPICGTENSCAMTQGKSAATCWCMTVPRFELPEALAYLTESEKSCVCRSCAEKLAKPV